METVPPLSAGVVSGPQASLDVAGVVTSLCGVPVTLVESVSPVTLAAAPGQEPYAKGYGAVLRSLARASPAAKLLGATPFEEGNVDSWVEFAMLELSAHTDDIPDAALVAGALTRLDKGLEGKTFLVGDALTLADIAVTCAALRFSGGGKKGFEAYANLTRFLDTCLHQPAFASMLKVSGGGPSGDPIDDAAAGGGGGGGGAAAAATATPVDASDNAAVAKLTELGIKSSTYEHAVAMTVEEQAAAVGSLPGALTRNLLVKDKKHGVFLVTAWEKRNTRDTKTLGNLLKLEGKTNLRLASGDILDATLKVRRQHSEFGQRRQSSRTRRGRPHFSRSPDSSTHDFVPLISLLFLSFFFLIYYSIASTR
jgi:hypothetical protein